MNATNFLFVAGLSALASFCSPTGFDSITRESSPNEAVDPTTKAVDVRIVEPVTVNGKPATPAQKAVAKKMVKQGAKMGTKAAHVAVAAITDPAKAERLGSELEAMGDEMERMGDSLEALVDDTTFVYEGADEDSLLVDADELDDFVSDLKDFSSNWHADKWWGRLFMGAFGVLIGLLAIAFALIVIVLVFAVLTFPIWILALIIWLIVKSSSSGPDTPAPTRRAPRPAQPSSKGKVDNGQWTMDNGAESPAVAPEGEASAPAHAAASDGAAPQSVPAAEAPEPVVGATSYRSGIMWSFVGVGLILLFVSIGATELWGVGALVGCVGLAKLVIAYVSNRDTSYSKQ